MVYHRDVTSGESGPSNTAHTTPAGTKAAAPTNLTASPGNGKVTLRWTKTAGADTYVIYHRDVTAGQAWYRMPYPMAQPCWAGDSFVDGHTHEFRVHAATRPVRATRPMSPPRRHAPDVGFG